MTRSLRFCRTVWIVLGGIGFGALTPLSAQPADTTSGGRIHERVPARWTFMVYMNGDNNLEKHAINDFDEMAEIGSTADVNIIVQMDRISAAKVGSKFDSSAYGDWTETLRFHVTKAMVPTRDAALPGVDGVHAELDMGNAETLADFVEWAVWNYPAERYALIIWDHGAGWRVFARTDLPADERGQLAAEFDNVMLAAEQGPIEITPDSIPVEEHPVKSVSHDWSSDTEMRNRDIQERLISVLGGRKLDVIGYDACLMGMVETAYAMRNVASVMVASEELEPASGWNYIPILSALTEEPTMDGQGLGRQIVSAYKLAYEYAEESTTLSAIDLSAITGFAGEIDVFAEALIAASASTLGMRAIRNARAECEEYGGGDAVFHNIDLMCFANNIVSRSDDPRLTQLKSVAERLQISFRALLLANYADRKMKRPRYGSNGLAIYFPESAAAYADDKLSPAYTDENTISPVEFVQRHRWDNWLTRYVAARP
jgi:hypothetical protein